MVEVIQLKQKEGPISWKELQARIFGSIFFLHFIFLHLHIYSELGPADGICVEVRGHIVGVSSLLPTGRFL